MRNWLSNKGLELSLNDKDEDKPIVVIDKLFPKEKKKKGKKEENIINKFGLDKMDLKF